MYIIHYSSNKNIGYVWRGIKANFYRAGPAPPRFEIPGSAPVLHNIAPVNTLMIWHKYYLNL